MKRKLFRSWAVNPKVSLVLPEGETRESLEEFILAEIRKGRGDEDQLLPRLCERTGWDWEQSRHFLQEVEQKERLQIRLDQTRLYLIGALVLGLVGAGFIVLAFEFQHGSGDFSQCLMLEYTQAWKQIIGEGAFTPCLIWNSNLIVDPVLLSVVGFLMIAGSLLGAFQAIRSVK